jgi:hypothetical protein
MLNHWGIGVMESLLKEWNGETVIISYKSKREEKQ